MNILEKLRSIADDCTAGTARISDWGLAERLLVRLQVPPKEASRICLQCDAAALDAVVTGLETPPTDETEKQTFSESEMDAALRAYRKRLKLARLDDESRLGGKQFSSGRRSEIDAIIPPTEFPKALWDALVDAGELRYTGQGFYAPAK